MSGQTSLGYTQNGQNPKKNFHLLRAWPTGIAAKAPDVILVSLVFILGIAAQVSLLLPQLCCMTICC
jgi:hypothetical protein